MNNLIKIKDLSSKYDITARTLRYYEDMGLIASTRSDDYAYRMYDVTAVRKLEQIFILRKLNISIKDIQRIFADSGSATVLEALEKKVHNIDDEVALLHELKDIVLDFMREIQQASFTDNTHIKLLYDKAKEIETQFVSVNYIGKPSNINRLIEIADKLDKEIPNAMVVRIPQFRAIAGDFNELMGWAWSEGRRERLFKDVIFGSPDFLVRYDDRFEYIMAIKDSTTKADIGSYDIINFPGGLYATAMSMNGDDNDSVRKVEDKIRQWLETTNFEHDHSRGVMGLMAYLNENSDDEILQGLGYHQLQRFVPIKLKEVAQ